MKGGIEAHSARVGRTARATASSPMNNRVCPRSYIPVAVAISGCRWPPTPAVASTRRRLVCFTAGL